MLDSKVVFHSIDISASLLNPSPDAAAPRSQPSPFPPPPPFFHRRSLGPTPFLAMCIFSSNDASPPPPPPIHSYTVPSVHVRRPYSSFAHGGGGGRTTDGAHNPHSHPPFPRWLSYLSHRSDRALLLSVGGGGSGDRITSSSFPSSFGGVCTCAPLSFWGEGGGGGKETHSSFPLPPSGRKFTKALLCSFHQMYPLAIAVNVSSHTLQKVNEQQPSSSLKLPTFASPNVLASFSPLPFCSSFLLPPLFFSYIRSKSGAAIMPSPSHPPFSLVGGGGGGGGGGGRRLLHHRRRNKNVASYEREEGGGGGSYVGLSWVGRAPE